jgi:hypothetical protein
MPSEVYTFFGDADLGSIIGYLEELQDVDRELPPTRFGPIGRALLAVGQLNLLVAPKTSHPDSGNGVPPAPSSAYGDTADVSGCHGCQDRALGRPRGRPPDLLLATNLTDRFGNLERSRPFARCVRAPPDGRALDNHAVAQFRDDGRRRAARLVVALQSVPRSRPATQRIKPAASTKRRLE